MDILSQWRSTESLIAQFRRNAHSVLGYLSVTVSQDGNYFYIGQSYTLTAAPITAGNNIAALISITPVRHYSIDDLKAFLNTL